MTKFLQKHAAKFALVLWLVSANPARLAAAPWNDATMPAAPTLVATGFVDEILGNRTRMIQAAAVVVAIGVFILSRKLR